MFSHKYRFTSTSGTATALTPTSILLAAGSVGTVTNTTVVSLATSVRISNITIWTPPASQGATATCAIDWIGSANAPNREVSDTTVSVSVPARVSSAPPPNSLASFWQTSSASTLCVLTAPTGSVIDVQMTLILSDTDQVQGTVGVATAVIGALYYMSLDPNATHRFVPVSLVTTI